MATSDVSSNCDSFLMPTGHANTPGGYGPLQPGCPARVRQPPGAQQYARQLQGVHLTWDRSWCLHHAHPSSGDRLTLWGSRRPANTGVMPGAKLTRSIAGRLPDADPLMGINVFSTTSGVRMHDNPLRTQPLKPCVFHLLKHPRVASLRASTHPRR